MDNYIKTFCFLLLIHIVVPLLQRLDVKKSEYKEARDLFKTTWVKGAVPEPESIVYMPSQIVVLVPVYIYKTAALVLSYIIYSMPNFHDYCSDCVCQT